MFGSLAFGTVGALVAARVPANPIGGLFCLMGLMLGLGDLAYQYADYALFVSPSLPAGEAAAWLQNLGLPPGSACSPWHCCCFRTAGCRRAAGAQRSGSRSPA